MAWTLIQFVVIASCAAIMLSRPLDAFSAVCLAAAAIYLANLLSDLARRRSRRRS
jgi:hypothetical protein